MPRAKTASKKRRVATKPIVRRHLLSLPAEIRNHIWKYVIGGTELKRQKKQLKSTDFVDISSLVFKNQVRFLYTCRQIYNEAFLMFYHRQRVMFPLNNTSASHLKLLCFVSNISPRAHRFVGFETCWCLNYVNPDSFEQSTKEERHSIQTLILQMGSLGWTRRLSVLYRQEVFPQAFIKGMAVEHQAWGEDAYQNLVKRHLFRMLLKYIKTEYLRRPTVVSLWSFIVKPNLQNTRQLLAAWVPWFDPINDPARWIGSLLLVYLHFRFQMPLAPKVRDTKTQCMVVVGVHVVLKILWTSRHWFARKAMASLSSIKGMLEALRTYMLVKRRKCKRICKRVKVNWEEKRKREAVHGLDASSVAVFALWPLLLCLAVCIGTIVYEYSGPAASLLLSAGVTVMGKAAMLIAYAQ